MAWQIIEQYSSWSSKAATTIFARYLGPVAGRRGHGSIPKMNCRQCYIDVTRLVGWVTQVALLDTYHNEQDHNKSGPLFSNLMKKTYCLCWLVEDASTGSDSDYSRCARSHKKKPRAILIFHVLIAQCAILPFSENHNLLLCTFSGYRGSSRRRETSISVK